MGAWNITFLLRGYEGRHDSHGSRLCGSLANLYVQLAKCLVWAKLRGHLTMSHVNQPNKKTKRSQQKIGLAKKR